MGLFGNHKWADDDQVTKPAEEDRGFEIDPILTEMDLQTLQSEMETLLTSRLKELSEAVDAFVSKGPPLRHGEKVFFTCCGTYRDNGHRIHCKWLKMQQSQERAQIVLEELAR